MLVNGGLGAIFAGILRVITVISLGREMANESHVDEIHILLPRRGKAMLELATMVVRSSLGSTTTTL